MRSPFSLQNISFGKGFFLAFMLGLVVRLIPEVLSYPYPIGFDTVYYAWRIKNGVVWYHWSQVFSTWLLYGLLIPVYNVMRGDPFLLLKLVASLLFGLNACGIYYFATKTLNWTIKKGLLATFFFCFQIAALRISWDLFRNTLGLAILLFTLPWIQNVETRKGFVGLALLSMLVVLSHEYASVIMFAMVLGVIAKDFLKDEGTGMLKVVGAILPASATFLASVYFILFPTPFYVETNVVSARDIVHSSPGGLFFLVDYLNIASPVQYYPTYLDLASHVFSLFSVLYLLWLPLVLVGFFRDRMLDSWTLLLLVGSFGALFAPFCGLDLWSRWMLMLVYPFTFYAVNGVGKVLGSQGAVYPDWKWLKWMRVSKRTALGILLCMSFLSSLFIAARYRDCGVLYTPSTILYLPSTMLHSTVPLQDVKGVIEAMEWLNGHMNDGSVVLVHHALLAWASLYLDKKNVAIHYVRDVGAALNVALEHGFNSVYLVWWSENIGWYGLTVPKDFLSIFNSGRVSVFEYVQWD